MGYLLAFMRSSCAFVRCGFFGLSTGSSDYIDSLGISILGSYSACAKFTGILLHTDLLKLENPSFGLPLSISISTFYFTPLSGILIRDSSFSFIALAAFSSSFKLYLLSLLISSSSLFTANTSILFDFTTILCDCFICMCRVLIRL